MKDDTSKYSIFKGLIWIFLERVSTQGLQFVTQIILARLLQPSDYGSLALVAIFITIANVFVQNGFNTSLIQKKTVDQIDYSSVFFVSLGIASIVYWFFYLISPLIGLFYKNSSLILVFRVLALTLFPGAFTSIQNAIISRSMQFKKLFYSSLASGIISGIMGITLANQGYGIWALVFQQLINQVSTTIILLITLKWHPTIKFSFNRIKALFSFSLRILISSLIDTTYNNLRSLFVGKMYTPAILGYYNRGEQLPQLIVGNINGSIQSVIFPAMSANQDDVYRIKLMMRKSITISSFIVFPMLVGLAIIANPLIILIFTKKWLPSVKFLQLFCLSYALWPIHTANLQAINAMGRSDIYLKLEITKKIIGLIILLISLQFGIYYLALGQVVSGIISLFINSYPNKKIINYGYIEQIKDILPSLMNSLLMGVFVHLVKYLGLGSLPTMLIQIA